MTYGSISVDQINNTTGYSLGAGNASLMKNRLINGAMVIDQRNAGSAVVSDGDYPVDRFQMKEITDGALSAQRSTTVPTGAGFTNSIAVTVTTADSSITTTQYSLLRQLVEGYNMADLQWGTAAAKTVTLSFWVRSSLTGTFAGNIWNADINRSYVYTYTINSANTWEYKSVTIPGCPDGTWATDNTLGMMVNWDFGSGPTYHTGSPNTWLTGRYQCTSTSVQLIGTLSATFYITGVQLEVGSSATGYEYRQYGMELALCQRYYWKKAGQYSSGNTMVGAGMFYSNTDPRACLNNPVVMRTTPSITFSGSGFTAERAGTYTSTIGTPYSANLSPEASLLYSTGSTSGTAGQGTFWYIADNTTYIAVSAEL